MIANYKLCNFSSAGSTVTVESLLVKLLQMLFDLSSLVPSTPQVGGASDRTFDPVRMISHLFQEMASGSDSCRQALCKVNYCVGKTMQHTMYTITPYSRKYWWE